MGDLPPIPVDLRGTNLLTNFIRSQEACSRTRNSRALFGEDFRSLLNNVRKRT